MGARILIFLFLGAGWIQASAETPALLAEAIKKYAADAERWAYTQTTVEKNHKGVLERETVVRYDPSQPFEEQWTLLKIDGREPTAGESEKHRKREERRRKKRPALGELLDLPRATLIEENAGSARFEIPLLKTGNRRLPPEKFRVTARVNQASGTFENVAVRLREGFRIAVVMKLKSGEVDLDFATIDPKFAPTITAVRANGAGSIVFVKVGGNFEVQRTDFKRVTPYSERFKVRIGPLQFLDY